VVVSGRNACCVLRRREQEVAEEAEMAKSTVNGDGSRGLSPHQPKILHPVKETEKAIDLIQTEKFWTEKCFKGERHELHDYLLTRRAQRTQN
jgi:hypothetical protein